MLLHLFHHLTKNLKPQNLRSTQLIAIVNRKLYSHCLTEAGGQDTLRLRGHCRHSVHHLVQ